MFAQYMQQQCKSKSKYREGSNKRREHHRDSYSQREKGMYSSHQYDDSYHSILKHHHMPKNHTHSTELKVNIPSFYGNKSIEEYLDWEIKVKKHFECH